MRAQGPNAQGSISTAMIANHKSKYGTDLLFVHHPLPEFKLETPTMIKIIR